MRLRGTRAGGAALVCATALTIGACGSDDDSSSDTTAAATETTAAAGTTVVPAETTAGGATQTTAAEDPGSTAAAAGGDLEALGLWDDGACDESLETLKVGLQAVFESGVLTLKDQAQALEAAASAFNERGGANGHCIEAITCDDGADPNKAVECVRIQDAAGVSVTVNDTTPVNGADVAAGYKAAGIPRFAISPNLDDYNDTNAYPFSAGGAGTSLMMAQGLLNEGITKIALVRVDIPAATALKGLYEAVFADNGLEIVADLPVPAGTTDYSQFILASQAAGAEAIASPLGGQEGIQILQAGRELGAELRYSLSLGSYSPSDIESLGDYGTNVILNEAVPPATADTPIMDLVAADLASTGVEELQRDNLKASPIRSWVGLYALLHLLRESGTEDFSRGNIASLIEASGPIPMLGLTADWTPVTDHEGAWLRTGNGYWAFWSHDGTTFEKISEADYDETLCGSGLGAPCT